MRTLIIGSIFGQFDLVEKLLSDWEHDVDEVVFLGNYFSPNQCPTITVDWLKKSIGKSKRTHLLGQNERPFFFNDPYFISSLPSPKLLKKFLSVTDRSFGSNFRLCHTHGNDWIVSPTGIIKEWLPASSSSVFEIESHLNYQLRKHLRENSAFALFSDNIITGGTSTTPGPTTSDWYHDIQPLPNINQIVTASIDNLQTKLTVDDSNIYLQPLSSNIPLRGEIKSLNIALPNNMTTFILLDSGKAYPIFSNSNTLNNINPIFK